MTLKIKNIHLLLNLKAENSSFLCPVLERRNVKVGREIQTKIKTHQASLGLREYKSIVPESKNQNHMTKSCYQQKKKM